MIKVCKPNVYQMGGVKRDSHAGYWTPSGMTSARYGSNQMLNMANIFAMKFAMPL